MEKELYFFDTEFIEDGTTIDLISIGIVTSTGREFYAVSTDAKLHLAGDWVRQHVLPQLPPYPAGEVKRSNVRPPSAWMPRRSIASDIAAFVKPYTKPEFWAYYADYDWVVLCQLFGTMMGLPVNFPKFAMDLKQLSVMLGSPRHPPQASGEHNALEDARWNRELYGFLKQLEEARFGTGRVSGEEQP